MSKKKKIVNQVIAKNIRYYRSQTILEQGDLGILAFDYHPKNGRNSAQVLISKFERGIQEPTATQLYKIASVLKTDLYKFYK